MIVLDGLAAPGSDAAPCESLLKEMTRAADRESMDFLVGRVPGATFPDLGTTTEVLGTVEGTVLAVRHPRGTRPSTEAPSKPAEERRRRRSQARPDPPGARVLTLLVSNAAGIPADVGSTPYRVILRFIREG